MNSTVHKNCKTESQTRTLNSNADTELYLTYEV